MGDQPKAKDGIPGRYRQVKLEKPEVYDLDKDIGEATDISAQHPDAVKRLESIAEKARALLATPSPSAKAPASANPAARREWRSLPARGTRRGRRSGRRRALPPR